MTHPSSIPALSPPDPDSGGVQLAAARQGGMILAVYTLWRREMVRFFRQRNRVVGALATPLIFWILLGSGLDRSFAAASRSGAMSGLGTSQGIASGASEGVGYLEYFFPGTLALVLLFTAIFSTFSVIEDRREGFLQAVLVAPVSRLAITLGKVLGGATIATLQGLLILLIWPLVGGWPGLGWMLAAVGVMFVLACALTALGLSIAWPMDSTAGFHAIMNLLLMPMWFLSGAVFPVDQAPTWLRVIMWLNPMTYGQAALAETLGGGHSAMGAPLSLPWAILLTLLFTLAIVATSLWVVARPQKEMAA